MQFILVSMISLNENSFPLEIIINSMQLVQSCKLQSDLDALSVWLVFNAKYLRVSLSKEQCYHSNYTSN